jgi:hypothetical protein
VESVARSRGQGDQSHVRGCAMQKLEEDKLTVWYVDEQARLAMRLNCSW